MDALARDACGGARFTHEAVVDVPKQRRAGLDRMDKRLKKAPLWRRSRNERKPALSHQHARTHSGSAAAVPSGCVVKGRHEEPGPPRLLDKGDLVHKDAVGGIATTAFDALWPRDGGVDGATIKD